MFDLAQCSLLLYRYDAAEMHATESLSVVNNPYSPSSPCMHKLVLCRFNVHSVEVSPSHHINEAGGTLLSRRNSWEGMPLQSATDLERLKPHVGDASEYLSMASTVEY